MQKARSINPTKKSLLNALHFEWEPKSKIWEKGFQQFQEHKQRFGHRPVPLTNHYLTTWVRMQRARKDLLSPDRIERLNAIGFEWDPRLSLWERHFQELKEFQKEQGHTLVPVGWKKHPELVGWVRSLRREYNRSKIPPERIQALDDIGFDWFPEEIEWQKQVSKLRQHLEEHGHGDVKRRDDRPLHRWIAAVRRRRRNGRLSPERIAQLDAMGLRWEGRRK